MLPFEVAEGMIVYAAKQADLYRRMAERAEFTRTEPKLVRGKSQNIAVTLWDPLLGIEGLGARNNAKAELEESDSNNNDNEQDNEQEDIEEDKKLLMGGEVD
jgi:hypothetical protein